MRKRIALPLFFGLALALGGVLWAAAAVSIPGMPNDVDPRNGGRDTELVSQFWGTFADVEVRGTLAYVSQGQRLSVFDTSAPGNMRLVGQSEVMSGPSDKMEIWGNYAFLADPGVLYYDIGSRLHILDISDPTAPYEAAYLDNEGDKANDIELYNGYAFIANGDDLWVVDVHDPLHPVSVKYLGILEGDVYRIRVADHPASGNVYAYLLTNVFAGGSYIVVVDVTDPSSPVKKASLAVGGELQALALGGDRAFILDEAGDQLIIVDISDPLHPAVMTEMDLGDSFEELEVRGNTVYIGGSGLRILDISDSGLPSDLGFQPFTTYLLDVELLPGQETVLMLSDCDLAAVDVTTPSTPFELGSYHQEGNIFDIIRSGDRLYLSRGSYSFRPTSVEVFDIKDLYNPIKLGSLPIKAHVDSVVGNYLYLLLPPNFNPDPSIPGGLVVVDVSDPAHMSVTDIFTTTSYDVYAPYDVAVHGNIAYYADGEDGLRLIDTSDPYHLTEIGRYNPVDAIYSVSVVVPANEPGKTYAYLTTNHGLRILDVTDLQVLSEKGIYFGNGFSNAVYAPALITGTLPEAGYYIALADYDGTALGIHLIDVSNPDAPVLVDETWIVEMSGEAYGLLAQGDYLYVSAGLKGVRIMKYDGRDFDLFNIRSYYRLPEEVMDVAVSGEILQLATGTNGLFNVWFGLGSTLASMPTSGGVLTSTFQNTTLTFPSGTFTDTVRMTYTPRYPGNMPFQAGLLGTGVYFELTAYNIPLRTSLLPVLPYDFELRYDEADLGGLDEMSLGLYYWNGNRWVKESNSTVDPGANTLTAETQQTGRLAVLSEGKLVFLPFTNAMNGFLDNLDLALDRTVRQAIICS